MINKLISLKGKLISLNNKIISFDASRPFIFKIDTTKGNGFNSFTLPLTDNTTDIKAEISDGQTITIKDYNSILKTINFISPGIYIIKIYGECGWSFNFSGDYLKIIGISNWGHFKFNYLKNGFYGCYNIGTNEGLPAHGSINAPYITHLDYLFSSCYINTIHTDIFKMCKNVISFKATFSINALLSLPNNLFLYNNYVEDYSSVFEDAFGINCTIPEILFNIDDGISLYNVSTFYRSFYQTTLSNTPIGNIQFIWYYINNPNTDNCFYNCNGLNNYDSIPNDWKGL